MIDRWMQAGVVLALAASMAACAAPGRMMRGYAEAEPSELELLDEGGPYANAPGHLKGQVRFAFDGFGSLSTDGLKRGALPWKLLMATLALDRHERTGAPVSTSTAFVVMSEHGFLTPTRIVNWEGAQPRLDRPLGIVSGLAHRGFPSVELEIAAFGCATCHAGPLHGPDGLPTGDAWLGIPNASMDLSGFGRSIAASLQRQLPRPEALLEAVQTMYPEVSDRELSIMRRHVLPGVKAQLAIQIEKQGLDPSFEHGGPGLMNGVAGVQSALGILKPDARHTEVAWMSPPALMETTMRRSLLVDATYAVWMTSPR
jgi:hypothetical protein